MNGTPTKLPPLILIALIFLHASLTLSHIERTIQHNKLVLTHGEGLTHNDLTLRNARLPGHAQHTDTVQRMVTQQMDMDDKQQMDTQDELFSCVTFSDTGAVIRATTGSILLGRVPSTSRRVHWVSRRPPPTSNIHRCIVGRRFVGSDVLATQSRAVFPESRATFARRRRRRKPNIADSDGLSPWRRGWSRGRCHSICNDVLC